MTSFGAAGKRDHPHARMRDQRSADILAIEKEAEGLLDGLLKGGAK